MRLKKILRYPAMYAILCFFGSLYIRLVHATSRWTHYGLDTPKEFWDKKQPFILAFWHGRLLMMPYCWSKGKNIHMLISGHADGQLISRTVAHFGIETIQGSKSKGGAVALKEMMRTLKKGESVGITPDGPRGPYMQASDGAVALARMADVPIIAVSYSTKRGKHLKSWDKFWVARPFTKGVFTWSEPFYVDRQEKDISAKSKELQNMMIALTNKADRLCGRETPR